MTRIANEATIAFMIGEYKIMPVKSQVRVTGIEPAFSPWKGVVLPINYTRTINSLSAACVASVSLTGVISGMGTILLILLILLLVGALPVYPYSTNWGYWPGGLILLIIVILLLAGRL